MEVANAVEKIHQVLEVESEVTIGQIELLETITENTEQQLIAIKEAIKPTLETSKKMSIARQEMKNNWTEQLDDVEKVVEFYEKAAEEILEWVGELDVKTRRIAST